MPEQDLSTHNGKQGDLLAAIDLGSNSFHMVVARVSDGELKPIDIMSEKVQLAAGLDAEGLLDEEAQQRGLDCLSRFAQRVSQLPRDSIRIVGTNALREAKNRSHFIARAAEVLDVPIQVIAGREEARLIYLGVAHTLSDDNDRRLVVDIGGGSTEFIIGSRFEPLRLESLHMGCVSYTKRFFSDGSITREAMDRARTAAARELVAIRRDYRRLRWSSTIGSSGTAKALRQACMTLGFGEQITLEGLKAVRDQLIQFGQADKIEIEGIKPARRAVLPSGTAILIAVFEILGITAMDYSDGALREGLLYDMAGRLRHEDVRERTIKALKKRYHVDAGQSRRVETTARFLLDQAADAWSLNSEEYRNMLVWAARTHEIGLTIAHTQFHKHSAYLLQHSDLPGFTNTEQQLLAFLARGHRRKFPKEEYKLLTDDKRHSYRFLCLILRLSVLMHRSRSTAKLPALKFRVKEKSLRLSFPAGWLENHPLTRADLDSEAEYLRAIGFELEID
ncbi:exopolyphosphatase [Marinobacterium lutimaris]|uniref:Exopolyphosphatase n=1 Tax=Marinobacterium lutimaris TaxID=568106 RepID=A0A1H6CYE2_9GAMM|nr:exopolyphosphatase [Marinobacterium lutimaris]SEG78071.1 exopolyphosphatase / guanosine-5'-triphosphate,3'-diphosphate pyrophosphatase [Marinobacterium lutimaris]